MIPLVPVFLLSGEPLHGVWVAKGYPGDWEETAQALLAAGVDHVLPCFLYGITPAYLSGIIPDSPFFPADPEWVHGILRECGWNPSSGSAGDPEYR